MKFFVYIVECSDGTLYTGITNDLKKRLDAHNTKVTGAKYTKFRRPVQLVFSFEYLSRSLAQKAEHHIKSLPRDKKISIIRNGTIMP